MRSNCVDLLRLTVEAGVLLCIFLESVDFSLDIQDIKSIQDAFTFTNLPGYLLINELSSAITAKLRSSIKFFIGVYLRPIFCSDFFTSCNYPPYLSRLQAFVPAYSTRECQVWALDG
jgi:hypothetical protein